MTSQTTEKENLQANVVIIGAGGAGLAAAVASGEKGGTSIIVLEKAGSPGGNTAMSHDIFGAESPVQKRAQPMLAGMTFLRCRWNGVTGRK